MQIPDPRAFDNRPVVHHFDERSWRSFRPGQLELAEHPSDVFASQSPLDRMVLSTQGGGANGTPGYLATPAEDGDQFYAETTPIWWTPARVYDLRETWITFYLREIAPISVNPGYEPVLFIAAKVLDPTVARGFHIDGWFLPEPLKLGHGEWAYNEIYLPADPAKWFHYTGNLTPEDRLDWTLGRCGYVGWSYRNKHDVRGVGAQGTMGWDEVCFNLRESDLPRVRAGGVPENALIL
jgi:hypothetical protein